MNMLNSKEEREINKILESSELTRNLSFAVQKEEIVNKFPKSFFSEENQSLFEYVFDLLHRLPFGIIKSRYVEECLMYLYEQENPYLVSPTKELYPIVAKKHAKKQEHIERGLRYHITKNFLNINQDIREEYFTTPEGKIPTNFLFLSNLVEYIRVHYYSYSTPTFTKEQIEYFIANMKKEDNAMYIIEQAHRKKELEKFLQEYLGLFQYQAADSHFLLTELILHYIDNPVPLLLDFYRDEFICNRWKIYTKQDFLQKMACITLSIGKAYPHINPEIYKVIFGDCELHRGTAEFIRTVSKYLKEQEFVRSLKR